MPQSYEKVEALYAEARERYSELGVDAERAMEILGQTPISLQCWQGDDVGGFESGGGSEPGGGLAVTGNYPGKPRTPNELRGDAAKAIALLPGQCRFNLHASYAETGGATVERNELEPSHFQGWIDWARDLKIGLDFNPTFFAHPKAADGFTLTHPDSSIRQFWIEHGQACRRIGAAFGKALKTPCVTNVWILDGFKDEPADRRAPRERLIDSLDEIFEEALDVRFNLDAVESKLFGIGSESYVAGSHEFYLGYAIRNRKLLCLDTGHYHPTESVADKISAIMPWVEGLLLHISRGVRWDSDHVVILNDEARSIAHALVRGDYLSRTHIGLDFFDASVNRVAAWVIGARSAMKAMLYALLEPVEALRQAELEGDFTQRLALMEQMKTMPFGAVWDYYCITEDVPLESEWLQEVKTYEAEVLFKRI